MLARKDGEEMVSDVEWWRRGSGRESKVDAGLGQGGRPWRSGRRLQSGLGMLALEKWTLIWAREVGLGEVEAGLGWWLRSEKLSGRERRAD